MAPGDVDFTTLEFKAYLEGCIIALGGKMQQNNL
jgi:hypothetical protein